MCRKFTAAESASVRKWVDGSGPSCRAISRRCICFQRGEGRQWLESKTTRNTGEAAAKASASETEGDGA